MSIEVLHECEDYIFVNKPFDMYINSEDPNEKNTVACKLFNFDSHLRTSLNQIHFVHRLDFATSGVLCLAKNKNAASAAGKVFEKRLAQKYYLAIVRGHVESECCDIEYAIGEDPSTSNTNHKVVAVTDARTLAASTRCRAARTRLLVLARGCFDCQPASVVLLRPFTGRRHQLRAHCHAIGHTILGDYTYSNRQDYSTYRMFLHAYRLILSFKITTLDVQTQHPYTNSEIFQQKWTHKETLYQHSTQEEILVACHIIDNYDDNSNTFKTFAQVD